MTSQSQNRFSIVPNSSSNSYEYYLGSKQQHDLICDLEESIICSMLLDNSSIETIKGILINENSFFSPQNKKIYKACVDVYEKNKDLDFKKLEYFLINNNEYNFIGGNDKLQRILGKAVSITNIKSVASELFDKYLRSELHKELTEIEEGINKGFKTNLVDLILDAEKRLAKIKNHVYSKQKKDSGSWSNLSMNLVGKITDAWDNTSQSTIYESGIPELDIATGGFAPGDVFMFAGPSGLGKTAFGCSLMYCFAKQNISCLFISGEMPPDQIAGRVISNHTGINSQLITRNHKQMSQQQIDKVLNGAVEIQDYPMSVMACDSGISQIVSAINDARLEAVDSGMNNFDGQFKVIFIDYLQLLAGGNESSDNHSLEIDKLAKWCKLYATTNNVVIILFAQINDDVLQRSGNRIPTMNDIGWCRTAKNHVDFLAFLWTDYYNNMGTPNQMNARPDQEILQLWFRKSRHTGFDGAVETILTRSLCRVTPKGNRTNY